MVKVINLLFFCSLFFFIDAAAKEANTIFHFTYTSEYDIDGNLLTFKTVVTDAGEVFIASPASGFEQPSEDARFYFPKLRDPSEYRAGILRAIGLDGKEYAFWQTFEHSLLHFLQQNEWEMDWDRIKELKEMATFKFSQSGSAIIAENSYASFRVKDDVPKLGWAYRALYQVGTSNIYMHHQIPYYYGGNFSISKSSSEELFWYLNAVLTELEIQLGAKLTQHHN